MGLSAGEAFSRRLSRRFDRWALPAAARVDGSAFFLRLAVPAALLPGLRVVDLGAGRIPTVPAKEKFLMGLEVLGVDLSADELKAAPAGGYDATEAADITGWRGDAGADLVVSHCLFEHVDDTAGAWAAVSSALRPGGEALVFAPCRNALFARANLVVQRLANRWKRALIPAGSKNDGWWAHYNRCTPADFRALARAAGLEVVDVTPFWTSAYFLGLFPLHLAWRGYQVLARRFAGEQACESFMIRVRAPAARVDQVRPWAWQLTA